MSHKLKKHLPELQVLAKCRPRQRKRFIMHAHKDLINCISEVCTNTLKGNVPLKPAQKKALVRYKRHLRQVADKRNSNKKRREILVQKGGFIGALIGPLLSTLFS